jgi:multiple sugar transport system substrate-binding protein
MNFNRRTVLKAGASATLASGALAGFAAAWAQHTAFRPERDAQITFLRYRRFSAAEGEAFETMIKAFTDATGVKVNILNESIDDVQPKAAIAANTGTGPDMILGLYSLPHLFPEKCLDVTDVANAIGVQGGGWADSAVKYGQENGKWITVPLVYAPVPVNYRISMIKKAGFDAVPAKLDGFMELFKALKSGGTPGGFALGHASSDANNWTHWCLWAHGGTLIDKNSKVLIDSPETASALTYAKALSQHFIPGTASWNDSSNNKAFLAGELSLTNNGISIYQTAKNEKPEIASDMNHAAWPVGPVGRQTTFDTCWTVVTMGYTKYPQACKALLSFMFQPAIFNAYIEKSAGLYAHPLGAFASNPVWTSDPKLTLLRDSAKNTMTAGHQGPVDRRAASALADFIVVDMFANVCTGREDVKTAMRDAQRKAARIYRQ